LEGSFLRVKHYPLPPFLSMPLGRGHVTEQIISFLSPRVTCRGSSGEVHREGEKRLQINIMGTTPALVAIRAMPATHH
jgi:hypothetical protein